ncbi:MAG: guanylate kinase, partial [Phototrophicales bacterium]
MILLISGAPGSGRTTLQKILYVKYGVKRIVTTTTRPPRPGEVEGVSYKFVSEEQFDSIDFCDKIEYSGYRYGLPERDLLSVPFSELGSVVLNSHGVFNVSNFCYE